MSDPTGSVLTVQDPPFPCLGSGTTNHIYPRAATPPAPYEIPLPSSSLPLKARLQLKLQGWVRCPTPGCCWTKVFGFFLLKTCSAQREEEHQVCSNSVSLGMSPRVSWVRDEVLAPKPPHCAGGGEEKPDTNLSSSHPAQFHGRKTLPAGPKATWRKPPKWHQEDYRQTRLSA